MYNVGMKVTVWIRDEDKHLWEAIENKSLWIHECLTGDSTISSNVLEKAIRAAVEEEFNEREKNYG